MSAVDRLNYTGSVDGLKWAKALMEMYGGHCLSDDEDLTVERVGTDVLHGWFANAIENGKNHVRNDPERYELTRVRPRPTPFPSDRGPIDVRGKDPKAVVEAIADARTISASKDDLLAILDYAHYGLSASSPKMAQHLEQLIDVLRAEVAR